MEKVLEKIVNKISADLVEIKKQTPENILLKRIQEQAPIKNFEQALIQDGINVICELKKASPSKGLIRDDLQIEVFAKDFEKAGASALSILTERDFFLGSSENLIRARKACSLPILRKDFIFDSYQILEARAWGADAILLIAAMLSPAEFKKLHSFAQLLGLHVLCEAHTQDEVNMLMDNGAKIIGINARNLSTFETSLKLSEALIQTLPKHIVAVAESAISTHEDIQILSQAGANAFLIGETLMRAVTPAEKLKELRK